MRIRVRPVRTIESVPLEDIREFGLQKQNLVRVLPSTEQRECEEVKNGASNNELKLVMSRMTNDLRNRLSYFHENGVDVKEAWNNLKEEGDAIVREIIK